jgi:hypothetical protein
MPTALMLWIAAPRSQRSRPRSVTPMWQQRQAICTPDQTPHRASSSIRGSFGEGGDWGLLDMLAPIAAICPLSGVKRTSPTHTQMSAFDPKRTSSVFTRISASRSRHDLASSIRSGLRCVPASPDTGKRAPNSNLETGIASWGRPEDLSNRPPRHQPHPKQLPPSPLGSIGYNRSNLQGHLGKIG